jgi:hypothetical protein
MKRPSQREDHTEESHKRLCLRHPSQAREGTRSLLGAECPELFPSVLFDLIFLYEMDLRTLCLNVALVSRHHSSFVLSSYQTLRRKVWIIM